MKKIILTVLLIGIVLCHINLMCIVGAWSSASSATPEPMAQQPGTLTINDASIIEGNTGTSSMIFTVTLTASGAHPPIGVEYSTADGTPPTGATAPSDYESVSEGFLLFPSGTGNATMTISVSINGDTSVEPDETFFVNLTLLPDSLATITDGQGVGTIINDDDTPPPSATLSINDISVVEGNADATDGNGDAGTMARFTVSLSAATGSTVTVNYATADSSATVANNDYSSRFGTVTFLAGDASPKTISIPVVGDTRDELDETFFVNLSSPVGATIADGQGACTIVNDDLDCRYKIGIGGTGEGRLVGQVFPADGGTGKININATAGCKWIANLVQGDFVSLTSASSELGSGLLSPFIATGSGNGTLNYSVARNNVTATREAIIRFYKGDDLSGSPLELADEDFTVIQGGAQCPASAYHFFPLSETFDEEGGSATIAVTAPSDCSWAVSSDDSWIKVKPPRSRQGYGVVEYEVEQYDGLWRSGTINIAGKTFTVFQLSPAGQECIMSAICAYLPSSCEVAALAAPRRFRDDVLAKTERGRAYTEAYYRFSGEAVQIIMSNPMLLLRSAEIMERYNPLIEAMAGGGGITLTQGDLDEIETFLNSFAAKGSQALRETVKSLCEDLRNPEVHKQFKVTITDGPKRSVSMLWPIQIIKQTGGLAAFMGFCAACVYCFIRGRSKRSRTRARRLLCLALAMLVAQPASGSLAWPAAIHQLKAIASRSLARTQTANNQKARATASEAYGKLALCFEANQGQADSATSFLSRGNGYSLLLSPTEASLRMRKSLGRRQKAESSRQADITAYRLSPSAFRSTLTPDPRPPAPATQLRLKLVGANPAPRMTGLDQLPGRTNYFTGKDSARWRANVPTYARVKSEQVYPGIDMLYYGNKQELEYDFYLAPGADYRAIKLHFEGAETIEIDKNGDLVLTTAYSEIRQRKPVVYQQVKGIKRTIPARYLLRESQNQNPKSEISNPNSFLLSFEIGDYDTTKPLIIDPVLQYSTYLGGSGNDEGNAIAVDSAGNAYVVGFTDSVNFPTSNPSQPTPGGGQQDVFVAKLNPTGTQLIYSTYLGGDGQDNGTAVAVDAAGNAYITGFTDSTNFPVQNALQPANSGVFNAFAAKLDASGSLLYSTHLGGSLGDYGSSITVDSSGNAYVAGIATSPNFPMAGALQPTLGGAIDVYVAKLNPSGNQLVYSTYLGGAGSDGAASIAVDSVGNVYLAGVTSSPNFSTMNPLQATHGGGLFDAFVAKVNSSGTQLVYSTYLGGSGEDRAYRIAVDSVGNAYVTGDTGSTNFPTASALQPSIGGSIDAFIAKLNPSGSQLIYSTYLGGSGIDGGVGIAASSSGNAYVTGFTSSTNFPTTIPLQQAFGGGSFDAFVAKLNSSGSSLDYSTYLGGNRLDAGFGIAVDSSGNAYVMGQTGSTNFPTAAPLQQSFGGGISDIFLAKILPGPLITRAMVSGKNLLIFGSGFDSGAQVLLNSVAQKTSNDGQSPATALIARKAGKKIAPGQTVTLQVRNSDGTLSNQFSFSR